MARNKKDGQKHYEILFIVPNNFTEEESLKIAENVKKQITDNEGKITHSVNWGKKKLAYPIKQNNHGYYFLMEFDLDGIKLAGIEKFLRLSKEVLRSQIVNKRVRSEEEAKEAAKIQEKIAEKKIKEVETKEKAEETKKKEADKIDLKDLDKKLDDLLDTEDLI